MILQYQLKFVPLRSQIDLCDYEDIISFAIHKVFPDAIVNVYSAFFEIEGDACIFSNRAFLQHMGRNISYYCLALRNLVKQYGHSRQLFARIR